MEPRSVPFGSVVNIPVLYPKRVSMSGRELASAYNCNKTLGKEWVESERGRFRKEIIEEKHCKFSFLYRKIHFCLLINLCSYRVIVKSQFAGSVFNPTQTYQPHFDYVSIGRF